jgi:hypothetical protein
MIPHRKQEKDEDAEQMRRKMLPPTPGSKIPLRLQQNYQTSS